MNHSQSSVLEGTAMDTRARMRYYGVSQEALAERCGVTRCYIGLIVAGQRRLTERIAAALDDLCREAAARKVAEAATLIGTLIGEQAGSDVDQELLALREKLLGLKAEAELLLTDKSGKAA